MIEYLQSIHKNIPELSETCLLLAICVVNKNKAEQQKLRKLIEQDVTKGGSMPTLMDELLKERENKGRKEKQIAIAKNMVNRNMSTQLISELTGLSTKEVNELQK